MVLLSLDIGGTKVGWAIITGEPGELSVSERGSIPTQAFDGGPRVAQRICDLVAELDRVEIDGVAVASAGVVDPTTGAIVSATGTMPGWGGTPLGDLLRETTGKPVWAINDVHAHGLGEAVLGAGRGFRSVMACAVGTGIGGAHIVDGQIVFGDHYLAGHFGHIHHHFAAGQPCSCGREGHIEAICSGSGITSWFNSRSTDLTVANGRELQELAESGNELAALTFTQSAYALGEVLGSLANSIDPSVVVLSGSMTRSGENWWNEVRRGYRASAMDFVANVDLRNGELGSDAPLFGAALYYYSRENN
ncbi:ROK family protein [Arcanobacterium haemolyticum]|uniref:ROK family protein n=1 Tax=Arcanobacterium haemolyticum (strain ATCC 9345 / DSM 20595 / CCM 5947 / CCUG 17215 / LMG 16163 / NBRC 15585 / NCTC 8452 / 11018) TaxID=644284 RepID=D7BMD8_ARCHD|nr:ROK family protein [Arcanobacterium haemolyticum]ADH92087.1 ROK family protein [Arcanobacterium haemolyticum DSM 20595]QCX46256.1 ROK family protein [Arcanobacterium haemolyticum]SPT74974.1 Glucokinase [Arcanobacterium haemolyticum]SQH29208.1 Glucokinase [Arcanobacterium haemolyticum]